jgi:hypothetical protein
MNDDKSQTTTDIPAKVKPLTRKQAAFVKHLIDNPKASASEAARQTYGKPGKPVTELAARAIASENLTKPNIKLELAKHSGSAESTLLEVMEYSKTLGKTGTGAGAAYAGTAIAAAKDILDRVHGKATQRTETVNTTVTLSLSLTEVVGDTKK